MRRIFLVLAVVALMAATVFSAPAAFAQDSTMANKNICQNLSKKQTRQCCKKRTNTQQEFRKCVKRNR